MKDWTVGDGCVMRFSSGTILKLYMKSKVEQSPQLTELCDVRRCNTPEMNTRNVC